MKYVALLRGIGPSNPNMRNEKLRELFQKLGFHNVQTVISTGNVLFENASRDVKALEATIEEAIQSRLGFTSATIIRSHQQLRRLTGSDPFGGIEDTPTARLNVTFLKQKQRTKLKFPYDAEEKGYTPDLMTWLDKQFGKAITTRTWKTVGKILTRQDPVG